MARATRSAARQQIDDRLDEVRRSINNIEVSRDHGDYQDYEHRMMDARLQALRMEKNRLKEIRGDL